MTLTMYHAVLIVSLEPCCALCLMDQWYSSCTSSE
uniref:Uncharacterized protein n=1 Tax=Anguilla anguilla TaxID=7936 RepID=A0A0E9TQF7_ANGAN